MFNGANPLDSAEFTLNCKYVFAFVKVRKIRFIWLLITNLIIASNIIKKRNIRLNNLLINKNK